jgi:hypothetical protein
MKSPWTNTRYIGVIALRVLRPTFCENGPAMAAVKQHDPKFSSLDRPMIHRTTGHFQHPRHHI